VRPRHLIATQALALSNFGAESSWTGRASPFQKTRPSRTAAPESVWCGNLILRARRIEMKFSIAEGRTVQRQHDGVLAATQKHRRAENNVVDTIRLGTHQEP
jgi:hypothetical protein